MLIGFRYELTTHKCLYLLAVIYREAFRLLDLMHLDMANYTIQQMRPYLKEQSVTYERKKFEEFLIKQEGMICHTNIL